MRVFLVLWMILLGTAVQADRFDFALFKRDGSNIPNSFQKLKNAFDGVQAKRVHAFTIYGGDCASGSYPDSSKGDCPYGSVRSMLREYRRSGPWAFPQPETAWYAWDMVIPKDYPTHTGQTGGGYIFVQWKGMDCPHASIAHNARRNGGNALILRMMKTTGENDCAAVDEMELMSMPGFKGKWRHMEVFAKWSTGRDGEIRVFIDGRQRGHYKGPTLDSNIRRKNDKPSVMNHFDFGSYLCCTGGVHLVQPGTLYFANVKRAGSREQLAQ